MSIHEAAEVGMSKLPQLEELELSDILLNVSYNDLLETFKKFSAPFQEEIKMLPMPKFTS